MRRGVRAAARRAELGARSGRFCWLVPSDFGWFPLAAFRAIVVEYADCRNEVAMANMQWWDWALLGIGAYIAVVTLARLMRRRREELLAELTQQASAEQQRKRQEAKKNKKKVA